MVCARHGALPPGLDGAAQGSVRTGFGCPRFARPVHALRQAQARLSRGRGEKPATQGFPGNSAGSMRP